MSNRGRMWRMFGTAGGVWLAIALVWWAAGEPRLAAGCAALGAGSVAWAAFAGWLVVREAGAAEPSTSPDQRGV